MSKPLRMATLACLLGVCSGAMAQSAGGALDILRQGDPQAQAALKGQIAAYVDTAWHEDVVNRLSGAPRTACLADVYENMDRELARRVGLKVFYAQTTDERKEVLAREAMMDVLRRGLQQLYPCDDKDSH
jgi:hypothetical protein